MPVRAGGLIVTGNKKNPLRPAMAVLATGIEMAVAITVGYFIGNWLDDRLGTKPWMMYVFLAIGTAAAFRGLWRTARRYWGGDPDDPQDF